MTNPVHKHQSLIEHALDGQPIRASDGRPDDPFNGQCPVDEVSKKYGRNLEKPKAAQESLDDAEPVLVPRFVLIEASMAASMCGDQSLAERLAEYAGDVSLPKDDAA